MKTFGLLAVLLVLVASLILTGCANLGDGAIATLPKPDSSDCQWRWFEGSGGGGFGANVTGALKVLTVVGPPRCTQAGTIEAVERLF